MTLATLTIDGPIATISMLDPARRNALSETMLGELIRAFDAVPASVRAVILSGGGGKVWCAGFDIAALAPGLDPLAADGELQALFRRVRACPAPVIGMLHGSAWGGGTVWRCDAIFSSVIRRRAWRSRRPGSGCRMIGRVCCTR